VADIHVAQPTDQFVLSREPAQSGCVASTRVGCHNVIDAPERALVLVVEDDDAIRRLLKDVLQDDGYEVVTAVDGESALELLSTDQPDLILMDVRLPGMDGRSVAASYRTLPVVNRAPIMFVSASMTETQLPDGVVGFIRKPFDLDELVAQVALVLREVRG